MYVCMRESLYVCVCVCASGLTVKDEAVDKETCLPILSAETSIEQRFYIGTVLALSR